MFKVNGRVIGTLDHIGSIVPEINSAIKNAEKDLGITPWGTDSAVGGIGYYYGQPEDMGFDVAFTKIGDLCVEMVAPNKGKSCHQDFIDMTQGGIHHYGVMCTDKETLEETAEYLRENGYEEVHANHGDYPCYIFDLRKAIGAFVEIMTPLPKELQPEARRAFTD